MPAAPDLKDLADKVAELTGRVDQLAAVNIDELAARLTDEAVSILAARTRILDQARTEAVAIIEAARAVGADDSQFRPS